MTITLGNIPKKTKLNLETLYANPKKCRKCRKELKNIQHHMMYACWKCYNCEKTWNEFMQEL